MSLFKFHLLSRPEPWFGGDNLEVACGQVIHKPVAKGMIEDSPPEIGFWGTCPKCTKAVLYKPQRYLYAIAEGQEAMEGVCV